MPTDTRFLLRVPSPSKTSTPDEKIDRLQQDVNTVLQSIGESLRHLSGADGKPVTFSADLNLQNHKIVALADPTAPQDGVNKRFLNDRLVNIEKNLGEINNTVHDSLPISPRTGILLTRAVPTTVDDTVDIGHFHLVANAHTFDIAITVSDAGFSVAKAWTIASNHSINADWEMAIPLFDTGPYLTQNFALDVKQDNAATTLSLRIRRTGGTVAGTATVHIAQRGLVADEFVESAATASVAAPTAYLESAILGVVDHRVGINTDAPLNVLHVSLPNAAAEAQLRLTDVATPTDALFQAAGNILNVDVLPATTATAAQIRMFRVTDTSAAATLTIYLGNATAAFNAVIAGKGDTGFAINNGNVGIGSLTFGTSAAKVLLLKTGVAPASSPADSVQLYSIDQTAGNACLGIRTEAGHLLKLYTESALTASTGTLANATTRIGEIESRLQALGLLS